VPSPLLATRLIMLFTLTFSRFLGLKNTTQGAFCLNLLKKISSSWAFRDGTLPQSINKISYFMLLSMYMRRSQWPQGLRRGSAAAHLLGLRPRIPPGAWMFFRVLSDGQIPRPEESYRVCVTLSVIWFNNNPLYLQ